MRNIDVPQGFEHQAKVAAVLESSFKPNNMVFVSRISLLESIEDQYFFLSCALPLKKVSLRQ